MPIFTKDGHALLFIHVPKVAGTSLERRFVKAGWKMTYRATRRTEGEAFLLRRVSPQHYHGSMLQDLFKLGRFDAVFTVVRDPIARFRSEYAFRHRRPGGDGSADTVSAWTETMLRDYEMNPFILDNHLRPQHEFLVPQADCYRLEDGLEAAMDDLNMRYHLDLPTDFPHALKSDSPGQLASRDVELSPQTLARLADFYAKDFAHFGYTPPV